MKDETRLRVREPDVAAKVIDGEAVIINLASGMYYSLNGSGSVVWELLSQHRSLAETAEAVGKRFNVPYETALVDIRAFCAELVKESLIGPYENGTVGHAECVETGSAAPYEAPVLTKFDDMADLFAADPPLPELPAMSKTEHR